MRKPTRIKFTYITCFLLVIVAALTYIRPGNAAETFENPHGNYASDTYLCGKCHDGHSGLYGGILNNKTQRETCYSCHDGTKSNFNVQAQFGETTVGSSVYASYHPVPTGGQLCTTCHDPHLNPVEKPRILSVGEEAYSSGNSVCGKCHGSGSTLPGGDILTPFAGSAHDTSMNNPASGTAIKCTRCHGPHGSPYNDIIRTVITDQDGTNRQVTGNNNSVCFGCHTNPLNSYSGKTTFDQTKHGTPLASTTIEETTQGEFSQGTLTKTTAASAGELILGGNTALTFNGSNSRINLASGYTTTQNTFTYEFWAKPLSTHQIDTESTSGTAGTSGQKFAIGAQLGSTASEAGVGVSMGANGISVYEHSNSYMPPLLVYSGTITDWVHVAVVYNNKTPSLYINGQFVKTGLTSPKTPFPSNSFGGGTYGYFNGQMDDVRIWNYARSQAQIQSDMYKELVGNEAGLLGYWKFNEGSGSNAASSATANNGTILNANWSTASNRYALAGNRISPEFPLPSTTSKGSRILWNATSPASTNVSVETNLYLNGSWQGWQPATNGGLVAGLSDGTNMNGGKLQYRVNLTATTSTVTPRFEDVRIDFNHDSLKATPTYSGTSYPASQCMNCHEPHGKTGFSFFRRAEGNSLCTTCHDDDSVNLPANYSYRGIEKYNETPHAAAEPQPIAFKYTLSAPDSVAWKAYANISDLPTPSNPGTVAIASEKSDAQFTDAAFWTTSLTNSQDIYNTQVYKFHLSQSLTNIRQLNAKWVGYGEPTAGHPTELLIWNNDSSAWETLDSKQLGNPNSPGTLAGSKAADFASYVDNNNDVFLLARAKHDGNNPNIANISVTNNTGTGVIVNWTTNEAASSYVYYGTAPGVYPFFAKVDGYRTSHAVPIAGLTSDQTYHYQIRTTDQLGNQTISANQTFHTSYTPSVPSGLSGPTTDEAPGIYWPVNLSWSPSSDLDPTDSVSYEIEVAVNGNVFVNQYSAATNTTVNLNYDGNGSVDTISWRVRAIDNHGLTSGWSETKTFPHLAPVWSCAIKEPDEPKWFTFWNVATARANSTLMALLEGNGRPSMLREKVRNRESLLAMSDEVISGNRRHFSLNTDYIELEVMAIDPNAPIGYCGNCHAPHGQDDGTGTPIPKQLSIPQETVCFANGLGCHSDSNNSARGMNLYNKFVTASTDPTAHHSVSKAEQQAKGTNLQCAYCHDPHLNTGIDKVVDPANRYTIYQLNKGFKEYVSESGLVYLMVKAKHDGAPPVITAGPSISVINSSTSNFTWSTDEYTTGKVLYGLAGDTGFPWSANSISGSNTSHWAQVTGLQFKQNYRYKIYAKDAVGNYVYSEERLMDSVAPTLSTPSGVNGTPTGITITWTSNELSTSYVVYSPEDVYGVSGYVYGPIGNDTLTMNHSVNLSGLTPGVNYHYKVYSEDMRGNKGESGDYTFRPSSPPGTPSVTGIIDSSPGALTFNLTANWSSVTDPEGEAVEYYAEMTPDLGTAVGSGWISGTSYTWNNLSNMDSKIYRVKVKSRDASQIQSVWSTVYEYTHIGPTTPPTTCNCPILYAWDGEKFNFITDITDSGIEKLVRGQKSSLRPDSWVTIPGSLLKEDDGKYLISFKNEQDEIHYHDNVVLKAVDHPGDTQIALNDFNRMMAPYQIYTYGETKPVKQAWYANNPVWTKPGSLPASQKDVTALVNKVDNQVVKGSLFDDNQFVFDLGNLGDEKYVKLVISGWNEYATPAEKSELTRKATKGITTAGNYLEILQPDGTWKQEKISFLPGQRKTAILDLTGKFPEKSTKYYIRLRGMYRPNFDFVGIDTSAPAKLKITDLKMVKAKLKSSGVSEFVQEPAPYYDYDQKVDQFKLHDGNFTDYGDVLPLLKKVDDKLVIMDAGDELRVYFEALPAPAPGMIRSFILVPWNYYKQGRHVSVEPLPFRDMDLTIYPQSLGKYPEELKQYVTDWNNRIHKDGETAKPGVAYRIKTYVNQWLNSITLGLSKLWDYVFAEPKAGVKFTEMVYDPEDASPKTNTKPKDIEGHYSLNTNSVLLWTDTLENNAVLDMNSAGSGMWQGNTEPTPAAPGQDVSANAGNVTTVDGSFLQTDYYPTPNQDDGQYNYQMFRFTVGNPVQQLSGIKLFWQGYAEPTPGYPVTLSVWNFVYSRWDSMASKVLGTDTPITIDKYTDYGPYCYKCHGNSTVPSGVALGPITKNIEALYPADVHGGGESLMNTPDSDGEYGGMPLPNLGTIDKPYARSNAALPCADCHDLHGSKNAYHLRENPNGKTPAQVPTIPTNPADQSQNAAMTSYCSSCHVGTVAQFHNACLACHTTAGGPGHYGWQGSAPTEDDFGRACGSCHYHGAVYPAHGNPCHCGMDVDVRAF